MNNKKYIRAAVELADGFSIDAVGVYWFKDDLCMYSEDVESEPWFADALAAQLVRQVDALEPWVQVNIFDRHTDVVANNQRTTIREYDRTMNTIKAIVDSEVLK